MGYDSEHKQMADEMERLEHEEQETEKHIDSGEEETIKLEQDLQKLNALQYLLNDDSFEELNHEVAVIKEDPNILPNDRYANDHHTQHILSHNYHMDV